MPETSSIKIVQDFTLQTNFPGLEEAEQIREAEMFRRRQLHSIHVNSTAELNPVHYDAFRHAFSTPRCRIFHYTSDTMEGDNMTFKADLITLSRDWRDMTRAAQTPCPIAVSDDESTEYPRLSRLPSEADDQLQACREAIGVSNEGWVPTAH